MLKKQSSFYRIFGAYTLLILFAAAWMLRATHEFFLHHRHHEVCAAAYNGNTKHFHDERYAADTCPLCAFWFSIPELVSVTALVTTHADKPADSSTPIFLTPDVRCVCDTTYLRGPPMLEAV